MYKQSNNQDAELAKNTYGLEKENYIFIAIGVVILVIGFMLLAGGKIENPQEFYPNDNPQNVPDMFSFRRLTLAPIVIMFGFAFQIFALFVNPDSKFVKTLFRK